VASNYLVAQRVKRLSSIVAKMRRFQGLRLSQMQDIGGCRAVLSSVAEVRNAVKSFKTSSIRHELAREDDYIANPKDSGYRGVHLIYKYVSDRSETYNGLKIEVQIRSQLQHAWATAVETVGTFIQQALKSSQGEDEWLRFFCLMGSAIALRE
jgi:ppGpp synthetase/RelA/SpoT-type nucleotidyltranferase